MAQIFNTKVKTCTRSGVPEPGPQVPPGQELGARGREEVQGDCRGNQIVDMRDFMDKAIYQVGRQPVKCHPSVMLPIIVIL